MNRPFFWPPLPRLSILQNLIVHLVPFTSFIVIWWQTRPLIVEGEKDVICSALSELGPSCYSFVTFLNSSHFYDF